MAGVARMLIGAGYWPTPQLTAALVAACWIAPGFCCELRICWSESVVSSFLITQLACAELTLPCWASCCLSCCSKSWRTAVAAVPVVDPVVAPVVGVVEELVVGVVDDVVELEEEPPPQALRASAAATTSEVMETTRAWRPIDGVEGMLMNLLRSGGMI